MLEDAVLDAGESWSGIELEAEEDADAPDDSGVEVAGVVDAFVEVTDCVGVEASMVLEADSDGEVSVDEATTGIDEGVEVLDEEDCSRSIDCRRGCSARGRV
jgi:hypothetical protein